MFCFCGPVCPHLAQWEKVTILASEAAGEQLTKSQTTPGRGPSCVLRTFCVSGRQRIQLSTSPPGDGAGEERGGCVLSTSHLISPHPEEKAYPPQFTAEETEAQRGKGVSDPGLCDSKSSRALREGLGDRRWAGYSLRLFMGFVLRIWLARLGRK